MHDPLRLSIGFGRWNMWNFLEKIRTNEVFDCRVGSSLFCLWSILWTMLWQECGEAAEKARRRAGRGRAAWANPFVQASPSIETEKTVICLLRCCRVLCSSGLVSRCARVFQNGYIIKLKIKEVQRFKVQKQQTTKTKKQFFFTVKKQK